MVTILELMKKLPWPKNLILRLFVGLLYLYSFAFFFPFIIGLVLAMVVYKKTKGNIIKIPVILLILFITLPFGAGWVSAFSRESTWADKGDTPTAQTIAQPTKVISISPTDSPTVTQAITVAPITKKPTATPTKVKVPTPTKIKISTPTPTKKIIYPTATPKLFIPTATPYIPPATNAQVQTYNSTSGDMDCPDFATHSEAQAYFISKGGSPSNNVDRLDADHDGIACEDNP